MAILVSGEEGTGRSSAMNGLEWVLGKWNEERKRREGVGSKTARFDLAKFDDPTDVQLGFLADVFPPQEVGKSSGGFLGQVVAGLKAPLGTPWVSAPNGPLKIELAPLGKKLSSPQFDRVLRERISQAVAGDERMVVLADGLDKCPDAVGLEALRLITFCLNVRMERLIFVVAGERGRIERLVNALGIGLDQTFSHKAEVVWTDADIRDFVVQELNKLQLWQQNLSERQRHNLPDVIMGLAGPNPKRIRSLMNEGIVATEDRLRAGPRVFAQELQHWFFQRFVERCPCAKPLLEDGAGQDFLKHSWFVLRARPEYRDLTRGDLPVPPTLRDGKTDVLLAPPSEVRKESRTRAGVLPSALELHERKLQRVEFTPWGHLLQNSVFRTIIEFERYRGKPGSLADSAALVSAPDQDLSRATPRHLMACDLRHLVKRDPQELAKINALRLDGARMRDASKLGKLTSLRCLWLDRADLRNLSALRDLPNLVVLVLRRSIIHDVRGIDQLPQLGALDLTGSQGFDMKSLAMLTNLERLNAAGTLVSDLEWLMELHNLRELILAGTPVRIVDALRNHSKLQIVCLANTPVSNVLPLQGLRGLQILDVEGSQVSAQQVRILKKALPQLTVLA